MAIPEKTILALIPRYPEQRSTSELLGRLTAAGYSTTPRSLQRRLIVLSLGNTLVCNDRSKPFGWSIAKDAPASIGDMSLQEAVALKLSQQFLLPVFPADILADIAHHFNAADKKLKEGSLYRSWMHKVRIVPPQQPLEKPVTPRNISNAVYDAVLKERTLRVTYQSPTASSAKTYEIEPLGIVVRGAVTYVAIRFSGYPDVTLMALHRFQAAKPSDRAISAEKFDLDAWLESGAMGFFPSEVAQVHLRFYDGAGDHLYETPLTRNQVVTSGANGCLDVKVELPITEQLKWWILALGAGVEVVKPKSLRAEIAKRATAAASRYQL